MFAKLQNKIFLLKTLTVAVLMLIAGNVIAYLVRSPDGPRRPSVNFSSRQVTVGVDEDDLIEYAPLDTLIDSLMIREFDIQPGWIRNDRVQLDNVMYMRKIVQIPKYFPSTLFNLDLTKLTNDHDWEILSVNEKIGRQAGASDINIDIGKDGVIYERMDMVVSPRIRPSGKEVFFIISGFGSEFDDNVKSFLELPETFSVYVPKDQPAFKVISLEAERLAKPVIKNLPWRNIYYLEERSDERELTYQFFELLNNIPNRGFVVLSNKPHIHDLIKKQFPRVIKRGYIIRSYSERW
ncbi:hypothetical protein JNM05_10420 [bacterium]|nr:hypothetical protein [bacterium]